MPVTDAQVKAIVDTERDTSSFITTAQLLVNEELVARAGLSQERLDQITLYLAAHFVAITEETGGLVGSKEGEASDTFHEVDAKASGLTFTRYGQQALILDSSGTLASLSAKGGLKAQFEVV